MALTLPSIHEIAYKTYVFNEYGMQSPVLIVGNEKALLLDTGTGLAEWMPLIRKLTSLDVTVALTHGHGDHIGGIGQFPAVWAHPADFDMIRGSSPERMEGYIKNMKAADTWGCFDVPESRIPWKYEPKLLPMTDGFVFDLGGRRVTVYEAPGHTPGEVVFVDDLSRILFSGDAANRNLGVFSTSVKTALDGLTHVKAHEAEFDRNITGHVGWAGNLSASVSEGPEILDTCISIMEGLLDGSKVGVTMDSPVFGKRTSIIENGVRISYDPNRLG